MSDLPRKSLPPDSTALIDRRSGKPRRITAKVRKAIALLESGECRTKRAAALRVGIHPDYLSRALKAPHIRAFVDERVEGNLYAAKPVAASRAIDLMFSKSEHVSLDAAGMVLGINGIRPTTDCPIVNVNISPGYCIDLASDPREALAEKHPLAQLRTIDGGHRNNNATTAASATRARRPEPRATPPFPDLVQTGISRDGGPVFSYRSPDDREES